MINFGKPKVERPKKATLAQINVYYTTMEIPLFIKDVDGKVVTYESSTGYTFDVSDEDLANINEIVVGWMTEYQRKIMMMAMGKSTV